MPSVPLVIEAFRVCMAEIAAAHPPSRHRFFGHLERIDGATLCSPAVLGELYTRYQAGMHATRAMVYHLPHLDTPALRRRKLQIFIDDDGLPGGDTHHHQLGRAFAEAGAAPRLGDDDFTEMGPLATRLDPATARFVQEVELLYPRSLGAWCMVEILSDDWMRAFAHGLSRHLPALPQQPYFADCFTHGVEERHAAESLAVTELVLLRRPELLERTVEDAARMARALDHLWEGLDTLLTEAEAGRRAWDDHGGDGVEMSA